MNLGSILIEAFGASGEPIKGSKAEFLLYNHRLKSMDMAFRLKLTGEPILLADVPAFPFGSGELILDLDRYRTKKRFVNVISSDATELRETFFLDPAQAKVKFPSLDKEIANLLKPLKWSELSDLQKAGLLNLCAKARNTLLADGSQVFEHLRKIIEVRPARLFALVDSGLLDLTGQSRTVFQEASGVSHTFTRPWKRVEDRRSFKTREMQANLQLTFATNSDGQFLVDMDIDDHQGIGHAFDVIGHTLTGNDTHPYDIQQVLLALQGIDPGYVLS